MVSSEETPVQFEANRLKHIQCKQSHSVALRVIKGGKIGYASTTKLDDSQELVNMAVETAEFGMPARFEFPSPTSYPQIEVFDPDVASISIEEMIKLGEELIAVVTSHTPDIVCEAEVTKGMVSVRIINSTWCGTNFTGTWINETPVARAGETSVNHSNVTQFTAGWSTVGCYQCYATTNSTSSPFNSTELTLSTCITSAVRNPSVSIADVDFEDVELNTTTDTKSFTITNDGNMDLSGISMNWSSTYDKYNITFTGVALTLTVESSDTADVTIYIPEDESTGSLTIPITFMSDELNKTNAFNLKADVLGRLRITDLDVKVDDKTDSNIEDKEDDYKINEKAEPESHITFSVRVENAFPDDSLEIQYITVRITIEEIDEDGDDLEEESDEFDLDADKDKKVSLDFDVPLKVDEDDYNVIIEIEGEDEDGNEHEVTKILILEVDKESHNLKIKKTSLNPDIVSCDREAELDVTVINIGSRTEEEVVITVKSSALGINLAERDIELGDDPDDDDNEYEKTFQINIANTVKAGTYTIETRAYYDEDKLEDLKRDTLQVKDCTEATPEEKKDEEVEVITPPEEEEKEVTPPVEEKKKFTETTEYVLLLILVNIIVIGGVVSLLIPSLRR